MAHPAWELATVLLALSACKLLERGKSSAPAASAAAPSAAIAGTAPSPSAPASSSTPAAVPGCKSPAPGNLVKNAGFEEVSAGPRWKVLPTGTTSSSWTAASGTIEFVRAGVAGEEKQWLDLDGVSPGT